LRQPIGICSHPQNSFPAHLIQAAVAGVGVKLTAAMIAKLAAATNVWIEVFMA
jgi:hypothetical protein